MSSARAPHGGPYKRRPAVTSSEAFDDYYKTQSIVSTGEWDTFIKTLQTELPVTFRVVQGTIHSQWLQSTVESQPFVSRVDWYPGTAYEIPNKSFLKVNVPFRRFLVSHCEAGTIFRQEAVSFIPALFLPIEPNSWILDLCAAPGSKTSQVVESLHRTRCPTGLVVANDASAVRGHMLIHRLEHFGSPCLAVTAHEAQRFPTIVIARPDGTVERRLFDCVLADVPCTGDGTLRKNNLIWSNWNANRGLGAHRLQRLILKRAVTLTTPGGTTVYSTCSLNPMENEAVISAALKFFHGEIEVVDCSNMLPGLIRREGLTNWKVFFNGKWYEKFTDVVDCPKTIVESMFPNYAADESQLRRCMRFLPHDNNGGGFFVAVLRRLSTVQLAPLSSLDEAVEEEKSPPSEHFEGGPLGTLDSQQLEKFWDRIGRRFGISLPIDQKNLFSRTPLEASPKRIWMASTGLSQFLTSVGKTPPRVLVAGCLLFDMRQPDAYRIPYRAAQWANRFFELSPKNAERLAHVDRSTIVALSQSSVVNEENFEKLPNDRRSCRHDLSEYVELGHLEAGACLLADGDVVIPAFIGRRNVELLVDDNSRRALTGLLNSEN